MILQEHPDHILLIRQTDHAVLSGFLAAEWGNARFTRPELFDSFCFAVREHDNGWAEWEVAPQLDPKTRLPYSFMSIPMDQRTAIHQQSIDRVAKVDPYAGLLVNMHCVGIYGWMRSIMPPFSAAHAESKDARMVGDFIDQLKLRQIRLRSEMRANPATSALVQESLLKRRAKLLELLDRLSLYFCMDMQDDSTIDAVPVDDSGAQVDCKIRRQGQYVVSIDPYPFRRDALPISILARRVPKRLYGRPEDFQKTLAEAPYFAMNFTLRAAGEMSLERPHTAVAGAS
jgi:hypothetical protein